MNESDKKWVVTKDGQRASGVHESKDAAEAAAKAKKLQEAAGNKAPEVAVKQQLNG